MEYLKLAFQMLPYLKPLLKELRSYESRVRELDKNVKKLRKEEKIVQNKVREEERHAKAIDDNVIEWLKKVKRVISEYENFCEDEDCLYAVFSDGYLPKPAIRYNLSVAVIDITKKVNALLQSAKHDNFSYWLGPPSFDADFDNIRYEEFESRKKTMDDIMAALEDSNFGVIGVYGWSGVGKTSLIKEVAKRIKGFDVVIMVNISHPDIRSIQGQIADRLGMKLEEESESGRAARLPERLKNPKEKTLVILDNMRVKLDFNMVGIPLENNSHDSHTSYKGCKVLLISDSEPLLISQMGEKVIQTFCVQALTEKEAEMMFKNMAEIGDGNSTFETLATKIAKECKGLPMVIVTTANALKGKSSLIWNDTHRKLQRQNLTATTPEFSTKLSYDLLENDELKHTFLICARMGHDALITDLVRYCIGLGILQGIHTASEARDRVHALVAKLKELSLLADSFSSDRFTMQDITRAAALSIASQQMHSFALTKQKLDEWPDKDKLRRYTVISLQHCDITHIMKKFPRSINCSRLKVFHFDNKDPHLEIPDNFFNGMKELRVLILIGVRQSSLPSSIKCLQNLRMLCLEQCKLGWDLSIIGDLETLRVLSLSGSDVKHLPIELRQLTKLQIFDISNCFKLEEIPAEMFSNLTSLEELYAGNSPIQWKDEGGGNQSGKASLSELRQLDQLTTLVIQIPKITVLPNNLFFDKLDRYMIIIREYLNAYSVWDFKMLEMSEASRYLALQLENGFHIHQQKEIKILFGRVENLLLGQLKDVEDIFYELNYDGFPYLKYLSIVSNSKVKSIINSKNKEHPEKAFPKLESLFLYDVNCMEHMCQGQLTHDSFCKLKIIKLNICGQLKNVFFSSMIKHLFALETIEVSECNSLKEIVTLESDSDEIKFPELRFLMLQSLSEFVGFYIDGASTGEQMQSRKPNALFGEKVIVSLLERMELSSINITKLWSDQSLTSFQNLIHLYVNDCWNMHYLLSFSMSKSLMNLQSLFVSECGMMESIFKEASIIVNEESIFPKLKTINLRNMKRLRKIWAKFPLHSFGKLDALIIEECNKLDNVFPSYMVGKFRSLCNLKVTNCKSMKMIFHLKGCEKPDAEDMTNLQNVLVKNLPNLEHVWNKDPEEILNFKNLKKIWVQECVKLKHIFPVSLAKGLKKLEYLEVQNCGQLEEIVSMGETNNLSSVSFEFPKLTTVRFSKLPNLESFYGGAHKLCCSTLNNLCVELCKLKLFRKGQENPEIKPVFLPKEEIYNLKSMQIEPHNADLLKTYIGDYRMHNLEEFQLSRLQDCEILYFFLHRNPNLKSLSLSNCFFEQLVHPRRFAEENFGVVPKLKSLKLMNLPSLKMIGFEEDRVLFQRLEYLILKECPCLGTLAPSSISFTYLTNLEVSNCNKLSYLMTPSTAKSLVQLTTMKVIQCESMKTIVLEQENEEQITDEPLKKEKTSTSDSALMETIVFRQLKEIELVALHSLERFYSSIRYAIEFPSLEKVVASECGKMESFTFSEKDEAPILRQICVRYGTEEKIYYCKGDLNATIKDLYQTRALDPDHMVASNAYGALESLRLKILKLVNCELESHAAIPTAVFPSLKKLEELEVRNTNVEVIFGIQETELKDYPFPLKKLTLVELPNLIKVWDKDREVMPSFLNLQQVLVTNCERLKTLFPLEQAMRVEKLKKLEIRQCEMFQEIVEEEDAITEATTEFSFPRLTSLNLCMLPQLTCFYPGRFTLECPDLNHLEVLFCDKLKTFQNQQEPQTSTSVNKQPLFSEGMTNFVLESLKLDWGNARMLLLCNKNFPRDMLHKLVELELDFNVQEVRNFLVEILGKTSNLECLKISGSSFLEELFPSQPEQSDSDTTVHRHSTTLSLVCLHKLCVSSCPRLTTLVHSALSFSNLKQLSIKYCQELKYLFTSSTARTLVHLEEMSIMQCELVEVILAKGLEETTSEVIRFERLNTIILDSLSSLSCFYSGSDTLLLSYLIRVIIRKCPNMKIFSQGVIDAKYFLGIQVSLDPNEDLLFHHDLNTTVKGMFQRQELLNGLLHNRPSSVKDKSKLRDKSTSKADRLDLWMELLLYGKTDWLMQNKWFFDLVTLKLRSSIPIDILAHLKNLEELEVCDSNEVEVIFYMNHTEIVETTSRIKKFSLKSLSKLMRVWEKNSEGVLIFQDLQEIVVSGCENLQTLFPASLAKYLEKLEKLEIIYCHKLQAIVEKEEVRTRNVTERFVFPSLKELDLRDLPQRTYFNPQTLTLKCPVLTSLSVLNCHKLELFQSEGTSINGLPIISFVEVISNLEQLTLDWKHISTLSLRFRSREFTEDLSKLNEISLYLGTDENEEPVLPVEILKKAPNLTKMSINNCNSPDISINSWLNTSWENLELNVAQCPHLTTLVHSTSTVSFSCLKKVSISNCPQLKYLVTSSAAKKLMNLEEITVENCESLKEIVTKESDATSEAIQFERLNTIVLYSLPSLVCFYSGSHTLQLSSLTRVHVRKCPNFKIFSQGLIYAESYRGIQMSSDPRYEQHLLTHQDLNTTVKVMPQRQEFFDAIDNNTGDHWLEADHDGNVSVGIQNVYLRDLGTLKLDKWIFPYVIPSVILHLLNNLEEVQVRDSNKVEVIFYMDDTKIMGTPSRLKKLTFQKLSGLRHVWGKNSERLPVFPNLEEVLVSDCQNLQTLFPISQAKDLKKLRKLEIRSCHKLQEIVQREEDTPTNITEQFVFPLLEKLDLSDMPQLAYFYPQTFTLECPALKILSVFDCDELELFQTIRFMGESEGEGTSSSNLKVISNLKELILDWKHILASSLNTLDFGTVENEKPIWPFGLLRKTPNLMKMSINKCCDPEILFSANHKIDEGMFGQLKILELCQVSDLKFIKSKDSSWRNTILENIQDLNVVRCHDLTTLIHSTSTATFSFLKKVSISNCPNLQCLFTSSAAEKLMNLEEITVEECESMKEIMAKESNATSEAIKFERLNTIVLHSLPSLICFYSGNQTLELTSLIRVHIWKCSNMKFFSERVIYAESFQGIQTGSSTSQDLLFHQDLNTTIKAIMQRQEFLDAMVEARYRSHHWLGAAPLGNYSVATQNEWLGELRALKLDKCILPYVIPSAILHLLKKFEELEVQDSDKVEAIFDLQGTQIEETPSRLMKLTLLRLPELRRVWGKNGKGVLIFRNLQEVIVSDCGNLQTLFPASVAKNLEKLEKLEIKSCHKMQAIVEKEEKGDEDVHKGDKYENEMIFQNLKVLNLDSLPKFESFYTGSSTLKFPSLKEVSFKCCGKKLFHHGDKVPTKLKVTTDGFHWDDDANSAIKLLFGKEADGFPWEDDVNSAIKLLFEEEAT